VKITYQDITVEVDLAPIVFRSTTWLRALWSRDPLRCLPGPIGLVSSRLFALKEGTIFRDEHGLWKAAPLLKPLAGGTALAIQSGFLVTGLYDLFGQIAVAHALGQSGRSFTLIDDQNPLEPSRSSLICFGSPTSNEVSGQIFEMLSSVLAPAMTWTTGFNGFRLDDSEFKSGGDGVVLAYESPWNRDRSILVMAGIGPAGTLAGAQLLTRWSSALPERRHRRCRRFMVAVSYVSMTEPPRVIRFRDLQ